MPSITNNEAAIIAAVCGSIAGGLISAGVSVFTARYTVRKGANYAAQISDIHAALASLAKTQEQLKQQHAEQTEADAQRHVLEEQRAEAAKWKPSARITSGVEGTEQVNTLHLESAQSFALLEASLTAQSGAKFFDYPVLGPKTFSTRLSIPLTHQSLVKLANTSQTFFHGGRFQGTIRYVVARQSDGIQYAGAIQFHAEQVTVNNTLWFKIEG